jgi:hypothetical protein
MLGLGVDHDGATFSLDQILVGDVQSVALGDR